MGYEELNHAIDNAERKGADAAMVANYIIYVCIYMYT